MKISQPKTKEKKSQNKRPASDEVVVVQTVLTAKEARDLRDWLYGLMSDSDEGGFTDYLAVISHHRAAETFRMFAEAEEQAAYERHFSPIFRQVYLSLRVALGLSREVPNLNGPYRKSYRQIVNPKCGTEVYERGLFRRWLEHKREACRPLNRSDEEHLRFDIAKLGLDFKVDKEGDVHLTYNGRPLVPDSEAEEELFQRFKRCEAIEAQAAT